MIWGESWSLPKTWFQTSARSTFMFTAEGGKGEVGLEDNMISLDEASW